MRSIEMVALLLICVFGHAGCPGEIGFNTQAPPAPAANAPYTGTLESRIPPPPGFRRVPVEPESFAAALRRLPLKPLGSPVLLYDGRPTSRQDVHAAVVDMPIGNRDIHQCADAVIHLRAEYLRSAGRQDEISFRFVSGFRASWPRWKEGWRPIVHGNRVNERETEAPDASERAFRAYMETVFQYANTYSLANEMQAVQSVRDMRIGDVFVRGGFPGHAAIVADMAESSDDSRVFLLLQSYMPAQEIHVLKNPADGGAWYPVDFDRVLNTPEWTFVAADLHRFAQERS
ncbi:MAG: DUF4846 domain-containing protein [Acidobacteriota bacterium]